MTLKRSNIYFPTAAKSADAAETRAIFDALIQPISDFAEKVGCDRVGTSGEAKNGTRGLPFILKGRGEGLFTFWVERMRDKQKGLAAIEFSPNRITKELRLEFRRLHDELLLKHGQEVYQGRPYNRAIGFTSPEAGRSIFEGIKNFVLPAVESLGVKAFAPDGGDYVKDEEADTAPEATADPEVLRLIKERRGQKDLRKKLIVAYDSMCAITGCTVVEALEAAHIVPHAQQPSYDVCDSILLRADIHTLFDLHMLSIEPATGRVATLPHLRASYGELKEFAYLPFEERNRPNQDRLAVHYEKWRKLVANQE